MEDRGGFVNSPVGIYKSPNPARGAATRFQRLVGPHFFKPLELLHTGLMEKQGVVGFDLQRGGKLECETAQEETEEKYGLPWQKILRPDGG